MLKYLFIAVALSLLAASGLWLEQQSHPSVQPAMTPPADSLIHATGRIEGASPDVQLQFEIPGRVAEVCVREGEFVPVGKLLMRLDEQGAQQRVALRQAENNQAQAELLRLQNGPHKHERREAKALWEARQAELKRAQQTWERSNQLQGSGAITKQEIDNDRATLDALHSQVTAAKARLDFLDAPPRADELLAAEARFQAAAAQLALAKTELAKNRLIAPTAGIVAKLGLEPGELAGPGDLEEAVLLVDTRQLRVRAFVEEQDACRISLGQIAEVQIESRPGVPLKGQITSLAPRMSRKQAWSDQPDERFDLKTREVFIELTDPGELLPGLSVDVSIRATAELAATPSAPLRPRETASLSSDHSQTP